MNKLFRHVDLPTVPLKDGCQIVRIEKITGDASTTRKYYRVFLTDGSPIVLMVMVDPSSDEASRFFKIHQFLLGLGIPLPPIHWHDLSTGVIALHDLGCLHLEDVAQGADVVLTRALYEQAVDILIRLQQQAKPHHGSCTEFNPPFTPTKFMEELTFFFTHYVGNLAKNPISPSASKELYRLFEEICNEIDFHNCVLCHRDYHARNIMLQSGKLFIIDFQDARLGPVQYDLVSLLRDSYVSLPKDLFDSLLMRYYESLGKDTIGSVDHFRYLFDVVSLQRNIKALGTFAHQYYVRGSKRYLYAIPRTCEYIRSNIIRYSRFSRFRSVTDDLICGPGLSLA